MPPRQTKLTSFAATSAPQQSCKAPRGVQRRLDDLQKVCHIKGGSLNFDKAELEAAKIALESENSSAIDLVQSLRRLSCLRITRQMLIEVRVGFALRRATDIGSHTRATEKVSMDCSLIFPATAGSSHGTRTTTFPG